MEQSIFDSELIAMNTRLQAGLVNAAPVSLESLGTQMREAGVASENEMPEPASNNVTIKIGWCQRVAKLCRVVPRCWWQTSMLRNLRI